VPQIAAKHIGLERAPPAQKQSLGGKCLHQGEALVSKKIL